MKSLFFTIIACFFSLPILAQENNDEEQIAIIDSLYREDQFYVGFSFNLLGDLPRKVSQSGFSGGAHLGFIRDMPVNEARTLALGIGLGWSINTYGQNLFIGENEGGETIFQALDKNEVDFDTNRFTTYLVEAPIEFRWRSSTPTNFNFWRVYAGLKPGYIYYFKSNFKQHNNQVVQTKLDELNRFRLGATLAVGYSKVNFYFYYSLNSFFDGKARFSQETIGVKTFKIGLMFYIL